MSNPEIFPHGGPPAAAQPDKFDELLADLRDLESFYNRDKVAQIFASQIENIFDKWLYDVAQVTQPIEPMVEAPYCPPHGVMTPDSDRGLSWHCAICRATYPSNVVAPAAQPATERLRELARCQARDVHMSLAAANEFLTDAGVHVFSGTLANSFGFSVCPHSDCALVRAVAPAAALSPSEEPGMPIWREAKYRAGFKAGFEKAIKVGRVPNSVSLATLEKVERYGFEAGLREASAPLSPAAPVSHADLSVGGNDATDLHRPAATTSTRDERGAQADDPSVPHMQAARKLPPRGDRSGDGPEREGVPLLQSGVVALSPAAQEKSK